MLKHGSEITVTSRYKHREQRTSPGTQLELWAVCIMQLALPVNTSHNTPRPPMSLLRCTIAALQPIGQVYYWSRCNNTVITRVQARGEAEAPPNLCVHKPKGYPKFRKAREEKTVFTITKIKLRSVQMYEFGSHYMQQTRSQRLSPPLLKSRL